MYCATKIFSFDTEILPNQQKFVNNSKLNQKKTFNMEKLNRLAYLIPCHNSLVVDLLISTWCATITRAKPTMILTATGIFMLFIVLS